MRESSRCIVMFLQMRRASRDERTHVPLPSFRSAWPHRGPYEAELAHQRVAVDRLTGRTGLADVNPHLPASIIGAGLQIEVPVDGPLRRARRHRLLVDDDVGIVRDPAGEAVFGPKRLGFERL